MRRVRIRFSVRHLIFLIVAAALIFRLAVDPFGDRARLHSERCLEIATTHASLASEYARNAQGNPLMLRSAAWHRHMRRAFEQAAPQSRAAIPRSLPFPPKEWTPPVEGISN